MKIHKHERRRTITKSRLSQKIQPFLAPYGIKNKTLLAAVEKALRVVKNSEEVDSEILPLVVNEVFGGDDILWISPITPKGCSVSFDILATAYAMWHKAQQFALMRGLDSVDAADALTQAAQAVAERIADDNAPPVRSIRNYLFICYARTLARNWANAIYLHKRRRREMELSDEGAFIENLENVILCDELLDAMPPKGKKATNFRYLQECSCKETAAALGSTSCAVRKAVCVGLRKAQAIRLKELQALGRKKVTRKKRLSIRQDSE